MMAVGDMAEPSRRAIGDVQNAWLRQMTELVRFAAERAAAAKGRSGDEPR